MEVVDLDSLTSPQNTAYHVPAIRFIILLKFRILLYSHDTHRMGAV
jgi:hypothetical protein